MSAVGSDPQEQLSGPPYLLTTITDRRGVAVTIVGDATTAVVEMTAYGEWSAHLGDRFSAGLGVCLAGPSVCVIVDLHHLDDPPGLSMPFWMAAWRQARLAAAPVRMVFCLPGTGVLGRRLRSADGPRPRVFTTAPEARVAVAAHVSRTDRMQVRLPPRPGCVREVREQVEHACHAWGLPHLLQDAALVASELAGNAVEHAGTDYIVTVSHETGRLYLAVQDGVVGFPRQRVAADAEALAPRATRGRGLLIVHEIAESWGAMPTRGGKVVWATLK